MEFIGLADDSCYQDYRRGLKPLALAAGKQAIAVSTKDKLVDVIDLVTAAAKAGELDEQMAATQKVGQNPSKR